MLFCYPADSGQDYEIIARSGGMRSRVVAGDGGWRQVDNPDWLPRDAKLISALYGQQSGTAPA
jgi:glucose-6-phosphate isomerase, archaeal